MAAAAIDRLAECIAQLLRQQGYAVLESFLSQEQLEELRLEADTLYELAEEERHCGAGSSQAGERPRWGQHAAQSCIYETIPGHRCTLKLRSCAAAYAAQRCRWPLRRAVWRILFESQLTQLVTRLLGSEAVLFNDQYILKPPGTSMSAFQWHRDSDWCRSGEALYCPYISVWCALDDMTAANGCIVVQPGSQLQVDTCHHDLVAVGSLPAEQQAAEQQQQRQAPTQRQGSPLPAPVPQAALPLEVPAGTAIVTSDTVLHCSGPNRSQHMRRAWMPQFAAAPLTWRRDGACVSLAIPLQGAAAAADVSKLCN